MKQRLFVIELFEDVIDAGVVRLYQAFEVIPGFLAGGPAEDVVETVAH